MKHTITRKLPYSVWLRPRKPSSELLFSLFPPYSWMVVYFQFKPLLSCCSPHTHTPPHTLSWLAYYVKLELCSENHCSPMLLIGCIVRVSGSCSYRCCYAAALLLAFPLRRAWLSSWRRWHVDNLIDWRQQQEGNVVYTLCNGRLRRNIPPVLKIKCVRFGGI